VVGLKRRLKRLEEVGKREETELSREALRHLSDEDLEALEDALEAGQENGSATFEDLNSVVTERGRRALENLLECIEAVREGREPIVPTEAGEEGKRSRNGYRIWKYRN
jgi:predicted transcriptional regulator